jgi:hypothetical protein
MEQGRHMAAAMQHQQQQQQQLLQQQSQPPQSRNVNQKKRKEAEKAALKLREQYQAKKRQELEAKHRNISEKSQQWNDHILPRWSEICESKGVGDLCMKGIPPSVRGKVWPLLIGNNLKVSCCLEVFVSTMSSPLIFRVDNVRVIPKFGCVGGASSDRSRF